LDQPLVDNIFAQVVILPWYSMVDGVIRFTGYDNTIPDAYLENAVPEAVISTRGISGDVTGA
jgi:hypothetical protein